MGAKPGKMTGSPRNRTEGFPRPQSGGAGVAPQGVASMGMDRRAIEQRAQDQYAAANQQAQFDASRAAGSALDQRVNNRRVY